mmetsp:Transcript_25383/g.35377  ORF Transcript_25383/g.35377 Transcript_25383/m.35377 type:complete len:137 (+) Transcript_25383:207-617(+)
MIPILPPRRSRQKSLREEGRIRKKYGTYDQHETSEYEDGRRIENPHKKCFPCKACYSPVGQPRKLFNMTAVMTMLIVVVVLIFMIVSSDWGGWGGWSTSKWLNPSLPWPHQPYMLMTSMSKTNPFQRLSKSLGFSA